MEYAFKMVKEIRLKIRVLCPMKTFFNNESEFFKMCSEAKTEFVVKDVSYV